MAWKTLDDIDLSGRRVLVRVDVNVPLDANGRVTDATRIERTAPTIRDILQKGGRPILLAHLGRPKGRPDPSASLRPLVPALEEAFGATVTFSDDLDALPQGDGIVLLENTRFHPGEEAGDEDLARRWAALGDVYVNDAFSAAHRAHASTEALARLMPSAAGRLMEAELRALEAALGSPERPVTAVVGGAKVSTKIDLLRNLVTRVDRLVIGGGMANTFLAASGLPIGTSLAERDLADTARDIAEAAAQAGCELLLPRDVVVAHRLETGAPFHVCKAENCPEDAMILDVGPDSLAHVRQAMDDSRTLVWNGPLGAFEHPPFDAGTAAAARHAAELTRAGRITSVAGGGDTVAALAAAGAADDFSYVSTAGGAFLEWMEGRTLPGVAALGG